MDSHTAFALFQIGTQSFGVPDINVVQAITYPATVTRVPRSTDSLDGVFMHRGQLLPLVDLAHWMGRASTNDKSGGAVLVLQVNGVNMAIRVDAVKGLLRTQPGSVRRVCHDANANEFFHSALLQGEGLPPITLLDPQRLAEQTQIWCQADAIGVGPVVSAGSGGSQERSASQALAVFLVGATHIAIPAGAVGEVSSQLPLQRMTGLGGDFLGMARWRGRDVPVVNICHVLGLPAADSAQPSWLVVLHLNNRLLGFYVQELVSVGPVAGTAVQTDVDLSAALKSLSSGSFVYAGTGRIYVLNAPALLERSPLSIAARASSALQGATPLLEMRASTGTGALIVFKSAQAWATPMASMLEIIRVDARQQQALQAGVGLPDAMEWRSQEIPVVDMCSALGRGVTAYSAKVRLIVVQCASGPRALLVESVEALIPGHLGSRSRFNVVSDAVEMITVGQGPEQKSYQIIDLEIVAGAAPARGG